MSSKPTHTAYVVIDAKEGSDKKAQWIEVGAVWSHSDGSGFDLVIPQGINSLRPHRLSQAQGPRSRLISRAPSDCLAGPRRVGCKCRPMDVAGSPVSDRGDRCHGARNR